MGKEIFIDANIFLEIFLKDAKSQECREFLKSMKDDNLTLFTNDFIFYSCVINVQNSLKNPESVKNTVIFFDNLPNLKIIKPSFDDFYSATHIMQENKLDFDDSLVVACMRNYGIKKLASFDRHFNKVNGIEKVEI
jgi:predicted nucleic acid-binding protein